MPYSDIQINKLYKRNPEKAIKYLFELYYDDLCRYVFTLVEKEDIAKEVVQEVFVYLWEKRKTLEFKTSAKSYLYRAAKNQSISYLRSSYVKLTINDNFENSTTSVENKIVEQGNYKELTDITSKAISSLPERCATIFRLSRNFKMSYKEIAENLQIAPKTVENQMGIALKRMKEYLEKYWFGNNSI